jgi:hypothetical protein
MENEWLASQCECNVYIKKGALLLKYKLLIVSYSLNLPGNLSIILQSIVYSPPAIGMAPIAEFKAATSFDGPAKSEVPVSAIAWQPPLQNELDPTLILNKLEY